MPIQDLYNTTIITIHKDTKNRTTTQYLSAIFIYKNNLQLRIYRESKIKAVKLFSIDQDQLKKESLKLYNLPIIKDIPDTRLP